MIRCTAPLIGFALLTLLACGEDPAPTADLPTRDLPELTLVGAYDVIGPDNAQPSGLTWRWPLISARPIRPPKTM